MNELENVETLSETFNYARRQHIIRVCLNYNCSNSPQPTTQKTNLFGGTIFITREWQKSSLWKRHEFVEVLWNVFRPVVSDACYHWCGDGYWQTGLAHCLENGNENGVSSAACSPLFICATSANNSPKVPITVHRPMTFYSPVNNNDYYMYSVDCKITSLCVRYVCIDALLYLHNYVLNLV